jgi:transketolase
MDRSRKGDGDVLQGGYVAWEAADVPKAILLATGSEVDIAMQAGKLLEGKGIPVRVVSLPSWELFDSQPEAYRDAVLPPGITDRVSIEAGTPLGWERYVGPAGVIIGIPHFGASAPGGVVYDKLGFTPERVVEEVEKLLGGGLA